MPAWEAAGRPMPTKRRRPIEGGPSGEGGGAGSARRAHVL